MALLGTGLGLGLRARARARVSLLALVLRRELAPLLVSSPVRRERAVDGGDPLQEELALAQQADRPIGHERRGLGLWRWLDGCSSRARLAPEEETAAVAAAPADRPVGCEWRRLGLGLWSWLLARSGDGCSRTWLALDVLKGAAALAAATAKALSAKEDEHRDSHCHRTGRTWFRAGPSAGQPAVTDYRAAEICTVNSCYTPHKCKPLQV